MNFLPSGNISNCPPPHIICYQLPYQIEYLVYVMCRTRVEVRECYNSSYVGCVVVFSIRYCLDNNDMYHMTKCNLLSVVCRGWNHNIDADL